MIYTSDSTSFVSPRRRRFMTFFGTFDLVFTKGGNADPVKLELNETLVARNSV